MENGGEGEVTPLQSRRDDGVEKQGKIFITDDEGIGGSENNSPRPGSSMAESRPPTTTEAPSPPSPLATEDNPPSPVHNDQSLPEHVNETATGILPSECEQASVGINDEIETGVSNDLHKINNDGLDTSRFDDENDVLVDKNGHAPADTQSQASGHSDSSTTFRQSEMNPNSTLVHYEEKSFSHNIEAEVSQQFQQAMSSLKDYQNRLAAPGGIPDSADEDNLKKTLETVTGLCQTCSSSSASIRQQLQQTRQLTDTISKDLTQKLQSDDLKDWIPLGYYKEEGEVLSEERQAAEQKKRARAAETKAALARTSHELQVRAQELARAEAELAETEMAAVKAAEVAEEAVLQLEAAKAAQEAKQQSEEKEMNANQKEGCVEEQMTNVQEEARETNEQEETQETNEQEETQETNEQELETNVKEEAQEANVVEDCSPQTSEENGLTDQENPAEQEITLPNEEDTHQPEVEAGEVQTSPSQEEAGLKESQTPEEEQPNESSTQAQTPEEQPNENSTQVQTTVEQPNENSTQGQTPEEEQTNEISSGQCHNEVDSVEQEDQNLAAQEETNEAVDAPPEQDEEKVQRHIEFSESQTEDQSQTEPPLTSQKVFQEVHVVQEHHEAFAARVEDFDNPSTWQRFIYSLGPGDWDTGLGCIIRATAQSVGRDDLEVTRVPSTSAALPLHDGEELISNIVCVTPCEGDNTASRFSPFLSVSLPHCAPRLHPGREPVVRMRPLNGGGWKDIPTNDVSFEDIKEHKFVEARVKELGTLCVVLRLKREAVQLTKHGGRFMSSADSRVTLTWPPKCTQKTSHITVGVQLLDQSVVTELRTRTDIDYSHVMSSSPVMHCQSQGTALLQPLTVSLPCPPNPAVRPKRPATSVQRKPERPPETEGDQRPVTARSFFAPTPKKTDEVLEDEVHVLWRNERGQWSKLVDVNFQQSKKKDVVIFDLNEIASRVLLLRTRSGLSQHAVERTASTLEHMLAHHAVHLLLRQHSRHPNQVLLTYASDVTLERTVRALAEEGYSQGPPPTHEVRLREGQVLELSFRGNLKPSEDCEFVNRCSFHNNIPFRMEFSVTEIDRFAQKGFESYRGFVQLSTVYTAPLRRTISSSGTVMTTGDNHGGSNSGSLACFTTGKHQLAELIASLPKPDPETPRPLNTAPLSLKSDGPITNDLLRHVAQQLAADDWRRMVPMLNIRRTRLQAILRQNMTTPPWLPVYDVLVTWSKRLPQAFDRTDMLCGALMAVGRNDLVEEVRDREKSYRQQRALSTRETLLNKAFIKIARHDKAVSQWRRLALFLGVSEEQVKDISARTCSAKERCLQSLQQWKDCQDQSGEDMATVTLLSHKLRLCRYRALAREIDSIR